MATAPTFGPYQTEELLGRGGMGAVYRAVDRRNGARVALKVVLPEHGEDARMIERFRREGRLAAAVRHENVVSLLDGGEAQGVRYLAFELVPGGSLGARLKKTERIPWREAARFGAGIAKGLAAIHAAGLVHRDLKPENVLVDAEGRPRIADLGLARRAGGSSQALTKTAEMVGTLEFMAPEQADSAKTVGPSSDLYSLGATLHALVAGHPPFEGSGMELVKKHLLEMPAPLRTLVPDVPPSLDALVRRLLSKEPLERGSSAAAIAAELEEIAAGKGDARRAPIWIIAAVLGVAAIVVGLLALLRAPSKASAPPPPPPAPVASATPTREPLPKGLRPGEKEGDFVNEKDGSILVFVKGATFTMGHSDPSLNAALHTVQLHSFYIGKYEVTNAQFEAYIKDTKRETIAETEGGFHEELTRTSADDKHPEFTPQRLDGASWRRPYGKDGPEAKATDPVVQITWDEACDYCEWAELSLPTEAQWELAAGGGDQRFPWGSDPDPTKANVKSNALAAVGSFGRGASLYCGALDMCGNAFEWCWDLRAAYDRHGTALDPVGPTKSETPDFRQRVVRGGSWNRTLELNGETYIRNHQRTDVNYRFDDLGFRVALGKQRLRRPK